MFGLSGTITNGGTVSINSMIHLFFYSALFITIRCYVGNNTLYYIGLLCKKNIHFIQSAVPF